MLKKTVTVSALALLAGIAWAAHRPDNPRHFAPDKPVVDGDFTVIPVAADERRLALYLSDDKGQVLRSFDKLAGSLARSGRTLRFAMNGGMYEADGQPVGLLVIDGKTLHPLNRHGGKGNFFLKPNGVFALTERGPRVLATDDYDAIRDSVRFATQSGPLLVHEGRINPVLDRTWARFTRNGVCALRDRVYFVISDKPVSLYQFAVYFKERLGCAEALYLDGNVSSLYSTALGRFDQGAGLGPIVAIAE